jgi:hypothetical protein
MAKKRKDTKAKAKEGRNRRKNRRKYDTLMMIRGGRRKIPEAPFVPSVGFRLVQSGRSRLPDGADFFPHFGTLYPRKLQHRKHLKHGFHSANANKPELAVNQQFLIRIESIFGSQPSYDLPFTVNMLKHFIFEA